MAGKMKKGHPKCRGIYECLLENGEIKMVACDPLFDDFVVNEGYLKIEIIKFKRIQGQKYE